MRSSASAAAAPMWKASALSVPAVRPVKIAFSSRNVSSATEKSVMVSTLVAALSAVLNKNKSVPALPVQRVVARAAVERVGAGVADHEVGDLVAGQIDRGRAGGVGRPQRLDRDAGRQRIAHRRIDIVGAGWRLDDDVASVVDEVGVVAAEPFQRVGAAAAVEDVGAGVADDGVDELVAGQIDRGRAGGDWSFAGSPLRRPAPSV